jgi:SAM-dependent methyltransferase
LERHRFLALLLEGLGPAVTSARLVLDIAPSPQTTRLFERLRPERYVRMDFDPSADKRVVDVQASLTAVPLPDASVEVAICYHVLEHVPDDRTAMAELARVLAHAGFALVQVPWRASDVTDEDPSAPVEERVRRFGQADHVRYYGRDFEDRLRAAGLSVLRFTPREVVGERLSDVLGLMPDEAVWLVRRGEDRLVREINGTAFPLAAVLSLADIMAENTAKKVAGKMDQLAREVKKLEARAQRAEQQAAKWERAYRRLRERLPIRMGVALARPLRTAALRLRHHR